MSKDTPSTQTVANFVGGSWRVPSVSKYHQVIDPSTQEVLAEVPLCTANEINETVEVAADAFHDWRRTPPEDRIQPLFQLKNLLEENIGELSRIISRENGKTLAEAKGEMRRAIENVEVACGIPTRMQGRNLEDVAHGIDEIMIRQPLGVVVAITPFNFPGMIPFWFLPHAIACGNTFILKPSERVPLT
ncbi:MAG: aldehyde dehydrogenase family protein, partial [Edaphobacter sp.]